MADWQQQWRRLEVAVSAVTAEAASVFDLFQGLGDWQLVTECLCK
jgi:hypothetical protein